MRSKSVGMRDTKDNIIDGRNIMDMLDYFHRDHKLASYTLNSVSWNFLNEQKEDIDYNNIYDLYN